MEGHCPSACLDLASDGLPDLLGDDTGLVFAQLLVLTREQFPQTRHDVEQGKMHRVVRHKVRPKFPKILEVMVEHLGFRTWGEDQRVPLETLPLDKTTYGGLALPPSACVL